MDAPAPVPVPSLEERERALAAREEAVQAQERALESRALELSARGICLHEFMEELALEQLRHAREVENLETTRDALRWARRAIDRRWRQLHNAEVAFAARVEAHALDAADSP